MRIGVVFPQTEYGHDPVEVRDFAQVAEGLGYSHIVAYDHVLGANPDRPARWSGPYTYQHSFLEPFVLFAYMASATAPSSWRRVSSSCRSGRRPSSPSRRQRLTRSAPDG